MPCLKTAAGIDMQQSTRSPIILRDHCVRQDIRKKLYIGKLYPQRVRRYNFKNWTISQLFGYPCLPTLQLDSYLVIHIRNSPPTPLAYFRCHHPSPWEFQSQSALLDSLLHAPPIRLGVSGPWRIEHEALACPFFLSLEEVFAVDEPSWRVWPPQRCHWRGL